MIESHEFLQKVLDTITEQIVVIDEKGAIQFINKAWDAFGKENALSHWDWHKVNYLDVCDHAATMGDELGAQAAEGIRKVMHGELENFYLEYPCHSEDEQRWFVMRVRPFVWNQKSFFVISHHNITERKLAEEAALSLSLTDSLTNLPNRRHFNDFLDEEWRRCARRHLPLSLLIIDIDDFKHLNDHYGHQAGDDCVIVVGAVMKMFCKRPSDLLARIGGDEFAVILGNTTLQQSMVVANRMINAVQALRFPNEISPLREIVTVSIGLASVEPEGLPKIDELIGQADRSLYGAKRNGKNRAYHDPRMVVRPV